MKSYPVPNPGAVVMGTVLRSYHALTEGDHLPAVWEPMTDADRADPFTKAAAKKRPGHWHVQHGERTSTVVAPNEFFPDAPTGRHDATGPIWGPGVLVCSTCAAPVYAYSPDFDSAELLHTEVTCDRSDHQHFDLTAARICAAVETRPPTWPLG